MKRRQVGGLGVSPSVPSGRVGGKRRGIDNQSEEQSASGDTRVKPASPLNTQIDLRLTNEKTENYKMQMSTQRVRQSFTSFAPYPRSMWLPTMPPPVSPATAYP